MVRKKIQIPRWLWVIITLCITVLLVGYLALLWQSSKDATDFQSCQKAGGAILESYPEQCMINGKTFTNDSQSHSDTQEYIGLSEAAALDVAARAHKAARVVERDGESLPVDASFQPGRLNFHIANDKVVTVVVEGE